MTGWFFMQRGWMASFKPEPFTEREAFLWSIEQAAYQAHDHWFNGHPIPVARGEFVTSIRQMADAFQWSIKRVRGFMDRMRTGEKWAQRAAHSGAQSPTIITVCNYEKYQDPAMLRGTAGGTAKGIPGAQSGHSEGTQQKEGKQGKERKQGAGAPAAYAFEGRTIRLNRADLDKWQAAYSAIPDIQAELSALDAWFDGPGAAKAANWWHVTSASLNRKHQETVTARRNATTAGTVRKGGGTPISAPC